MEKARYMIVYHIEKAYFFGNPQRYQDFEEENMERQSWNVKTIVMIGFFAAITYLGIQAFRIPMPAAVGTPFLHFGHIFVVLGIIVLGGKKGAISGTLGLLVFDLLNGYVAAMPKIFVETVIKCLVVGALLSLAEKRAGDDKRKRYAYTLVCTVVYVFGTLFFEWLFGAAELIIAGSGVGAAAAAAATSLPATAINGAFTVIGIAAAYVPVTSGLKRAGMAAV